MNDVSHKTTVLCSMLDRSEEGAKDSIFTYTGGSNLTLTTLLKIAESAFLFGHRLRSKGSPKTLPMQKEILLAPRHLSHDRSPETDHSQVTHLRLFSMKNRACGAKTPLVSVSSPLTSAAPTISILLGSALRLLLR